MYSVIVPFTDLQDDNYKYKVGDAYPRKGYAPSSSRIKELSGDKNKLGKSLIVEVATVTRRSNKKKNNDD